MTNNEILRELREREPQLPLNGYSLGMLLKGADFGRVQQKRNGKPKRGYRVARVAG